MNYVFENDKANDGYFDVLDSEHSLEGLHIDDELFSFSNKLMIKFDETKLPSNEILNYEVDDQDYYKSYDYENTPEDILDPDLKIESLSLFAEKDSNLHPDIALDHDNCEGANHLCKDPTTKEIANSLGEVIDSTSIQDVKISYSQSNYRLSNEIMIQNSKTENRSLRRTRKAR